MNVTEENILDRSRLMRKKMNMTCFMGWLHSIDVLTVDDVHRCLNLFMDHPDDVYGLGACHGLILVAKDRLCTGKSWKSMGDFLVKLDARYPKENVPAPFQTLLTVGFALIVTFFAR
jgi:hypothetical protein